MFNAISFDTNMLLGLAVDVLAVVILLLFLVVGAKRGAIRMTTGLVSFIGTIVLAILLVSPVTKLVIQSTSLDDKLMSALESPIASKLPGSYDTLYYTDLDGDPSTPDELVCDKNNVATPYDQLFDGADGTSKILKTLNIQKFIKPMVEKTLAEGNVDHIYLVDAITFSLATVIITCGVFIVLMILLRIIIGILMRLLSKGAKSLYVIHFLDKFTGAILGIVFGAVIVLVLITLVQIMQNLSFMSPVMEAVSRSYLVKFVMDNNFLYALLMNQLNFDELLAKLFPGGQA
jgi:uncharacterized membrane protein required for colicin V production